MKGDLRGPPCFLFRTASLNFSFKKLMPQYCSRKPHVRYLLTAQNLCLFQAAKKVADAKLTKDYESVLKDFEKAQLLAAEKEKSFAPPIANSTRQPR